MKIGELINSLSDLLKLAQNVDQYEKFHRDNISDVYKKVIPIEEGTITVCVEYDRVPSEKLNESYNLLSKCFDEFYQEFLRKISSDKITD